MCEDMHGQGRFDVYERKSLGKQEKESDKFIEERTLVSSRGLTVICQSSLVLLWPLNALQDLAPSAGSWRPTNLRQ
jgi:hypothetical protein